MPADSVQPRKRRGSALLESTLVLMVFLTTVIGVFDFGQFLFLHQTIVQRATNAARYSAVQGVSAEQVKNLVVYNSVSAPQVNADGGNGAVPGIFGLTPSMVTVVTSGVGTSTARVTVTVQNYNFSFLSPLIAALVRGQPIRVTIPIEST